MTKVGILTFHEGFNHGGFFQAFFLQRIVESLGHEALVLNYKNPAHWASENFSQFWLLGPRLMLSNLKKRSAFRRDQKRFRVWPEHLTFFSRRIGRLSRQLDFIIVGSDIIWDYDYKSTGKGLIYFGRGLRPIRGLVSYAASMGRSRHPLPAYVTSGLRSFERISVRDANTRDLVETAIGETPEKVVDPTLLIPIDSLEIPSYSGNLLPARYLLLYAYYLPKTWIPGIESFARSRGIEIVITGYDQPIEGISALEMGPFDWLHAVKGAEFIITSTYHGTIFALLNHKRFMTIANDGILHKALSLLRDLKLEDRYVEDGFDSKKLVEPVEWDQIQADLCSLREASLTFLAKALQVSR